jgi:hypothetical protein
MVLVSKPKRSGSVHHKRRHGHHHKRSGDYLRPYWPYLPIALMVAVGIVASNLWGTVQQNVLSYATNTSISGLQTNTNAERAANGLGALALNSLLNQAAQAKANDMATRDYWSHNTPEGNPPWIFFTNAGYQYETAGENLAYGFDNSGDTVTAWMNSPGHRANILNTTYQEVGFGMANASNYQGTGPQTVVVAMYGKPYGVAAATTPAPAPAPAPAPQPAAPAPEPTPEPTQVAQETPAPEPAPETNTTTKEPAAATNEEVSNEPVTATNVSRIQLLTGESWSMLLLSGLAVISVAFFFIRHGMFWHKALVKGEAFFIKHKLLDVILVGVAILGFILTRTAGIIR